MNSVERQTHWENVYTTKGERFSWFEDSPTISLDLIRSTGVSTSADWPAKAAALGWGAADLFGCDRDRPFARVNRMGLLWLLNGRRLVALTAGSATIEKTACDGRLTYRRVSNDPGRVLVWEPCEAAP